MEVLVQIDAGDLVQDVDDGMGVAVRQCTVIFVAIPAVMFRTPYTAVSLEFVNTDGLGEFGWPSEADGLKDRLDSALGDMVSSRDLREGERLYQIQENGVIESLRHTQGRMDPVGSLIERGVTVLAQEPALVEGDDGTTMVTGDVSDSLYGTGVLDDTVIGTAVRTQSLTGYRYIESDEIVVLEDLNVFDSCFLWQFCQIVGCFHSRFRPPKKDLPKNQQVEEVFGCFRHTRDFRCRIIISLDSWNDYGSI